MPVSIPTSKDWSPFYRRTAGEGVKGSEVVLNFPDIASPLPPKLRHKKKYEEVQGGLIGSPGAFMTPGGSILDDDLVRGHSAPGSAGSSCRAKLVLFEGEQVDGVEHDGHRHKALDAGEHAESASFGGECGLGDGDGPQSPRLDLDLFLGLGTGSTPPPVTSASLGAHHQGISAAQKVAGELLFGAHGSEMASLRSSGGDSGSGSGSRARRKKSNKTLGQDMFAFDVDLEGPGVFGGMGHATHTSKASLQRGAGSGSAGGSANKDRDRKGRGRGGGGSSRKGVGRKGEDAKGLDIGTLGINSPLGFTHGTPGAATHGPASISPQLNKMVGCNCRKSRCLKLYCDCFRRQSYCFDGCHCNDCANLEQYEEERNQAISSILDRNPEAFRPRVAIEEHEDGTQASVGQHLSGCRCKRSACLKKYCECFTAGVYCSQKCSCLDCRNHGGDGMKEGAASVSLVIESAKSGAAHERAGSTAAEAVAALIQQEKQEAVY
jgi:hypothetical protein